MPSTNQFKLLACVAVSNLATVLSSVNVKSAATDCWAVAAVNTATIKPQERARRVGLEEIRSVELIRLPCDVVFWGESNKRTCYIYPRRKNTSKFAVRIL